ncbi:uncharacterized protein [Panulirus ornatus]|uniref:uncharacterized protein n=1 Tax=Panulirus ornatus TaxID=150431 RepID=UPI003A8B2C5F
MASNKKTVNIRSTTYPNHETMKKNKKPVFSLRRMNSFDYSYQDTSPTTKEERGAREVSAEGRLRVHQFHQTHSASSSSASSSTSLAPGQKLLRFSDECWCSSAAEQGSATSPKFRQRSASRLSMCSNVVRMVDWQRHLPERHSLSPTNSQESSERHSRSSERRSEKNLSLAERRRSQFCPSISLPPSSKLQAEPPTSAVNSKTPTATTTTVSTEGRRRRSQFRRAWSLFSLTCDKEVDRREKSPQQRILRQPTRHFYRRGLSGLPIECSSNKLGLAY